MIMERVMDMKKTLKLLLILILLFNLSSCASQKYSISVISENGDISNTDKAYIEKEAQNSIDKISHYWQFKNKNKQDITIHIQDGFSYTNGTDIFLKNPLVKYKKAPITHEMTHCLMNLEPSVNGDNAFFNEGTAILMAELYGPKNNFQYFDSTTSRYIFTNAKQAVVGIKNLIDLKSLENNYDIFENISDSPTKVERLNRNKAYAEAGSFFLFLNDKYGQAKLKDFYYSQTKLNFKGIFGESLNNLEIEWKSYFKLK